MKTTRFHRLVSLCLVLLLCLLPLTSFAQEKPKLVMLFSAGGSGNALKSAAERFAELNDIEVEALLFSITEVYEKEVLALSSKQDSPDIISMDDTWFPLMKDYLSELELEDAYKQQFIPSMLETFSWNGKNYGVPARMGGEVICYRTDILEEAGIDPASLTTWEAVLEAAIQLTDPEKGVYGWVGGYNEPAYITAIWLNVMSSYGVDIFNEDHTAFGFNTPMGVEGTQVFVDLTAKAASPGVLSYGYAEEIEAFQNGSAVMGQLWSARFAAVNDPQLPNSGKFDVLPFYPYGANSGLTTGVDRVNGWGLGVNINSKNQELAKQFVEFVGSYDEQLRLAVEMSNSPVLSGIFNEETYIQAVPVAKNMESAMQHGVPRPMHIKWAEIEGVIALNLERAIIGEIPVEEALAQAEEAALKILND